MKWYQATPLPLRDVLEVLGDLAPDQQVREQVADGGSIRAPEHHSESSEVVYVHQTRLKVVVPSMPYDAKGLLTSAIRSPNLVIFLEPKLIYRAFREEVPTGFYEVPLREAAIRRDDEGVSVFTWGAMTRPTMEAADQLIDEGINAEVVDLRTLSPLHEETIVDPFRKTGRGAVVHDAPKTSGLTGQSTATVQEEVLLYQEAAGARARRDGGAPRNGERGGTTRERGG